MKTGYKSAEREDDLPEAKVVTRHWHFPIIWIVPLVAVLVAGYLVYQRIREYGDKVTIRFKEGAGLKAGETTVQYRGVTIGQVVAVELSSNLQSVVVTARINRSAAGVAREGSAFWVVRPQVGVGNITGLTTIITGPSIEVRPGNGPARFDFVGLETSPATVEPGSLEIVLLTGHLGALKAGSPVYYRGVEVGAVHESVLSTNSQAVEIRVSINQRYAKLVRTGSKFWNVSGVDVKVGLFRGAEINVESLRSLAVGGVAFATPNDTNATIAGNGMVFVLNQEAKKEWQEWAPEIPIPAEK